MSQSAGRLSQQSVKRTPLLVNRKTKGGGSSYSKASGIKLSNNE